MWRSSWFKIRTYFYKNYSFSAVVVVVLVIIFFVLALGANLVTSQFQNFVYLADAFIHGQLHYYTLPPLLHDTTPFNGRYYWDQGPFPAVILMPLVALFGLLPWQGYLHIFLTILVFGLAFRLAKLQNIKAIDSLWLAFAFLFASIYLGVVFKALVWQFSLAVATVLSLLIIYEYLTRRRYWLIGIYAAFLLATRATAGLIVGVVLLDVFFQKKPWRDKLRPLVKIASPILLVIVLLLAYNQARFGNPFDTGYSRALVRPAEMVRAREVYGLFSWRNIPTNIYYYFLSPPRPLVDPSTNHLVPPYLVGNFAMGFFFLSPIFLLALRSRLDSRFLKCTAIVAGLILLILLSYYATSYYHFGAYYLVDIMPLLYILLIDNFKNQSLWRRDKLVIAASALFNFYLLLTLSVKL